MASPSPWFGMGITAIVACRLGVERAKIAEKIGGGFIEIAAAPTNS